MALLGKLLEFAVLFSRVGDDVLIVGLVFKNGTDVSDVGSIDGDRVSLEVFLGHDVQREGRDVGVSVLLTLSEVGDEGRDVLLELGQVHGHIVLVELRVLVVLLMAGDGELESAIVELGNHGPAVVTDADHLVLDVVDLGLLGSNLALAFVDLALEVVLGFLLLLRGHVVEFGVPLELLVDVLVLLLNHVDFAVEHVDIVEERDVLLLSLDESGHDFVNGGDTSGLLDLLESVLNDLNVADVHVHEVLLLLVVVDNLVEADFEEDGRVGEVSHSGLLFGAHVFGAGLLSLVLILLLQLFLKVEDAVLEVELVHVMLSLKSKNLVLGLLAESVASLGEAVALLNLVNETADLLVVASIDLVLDGLLLTSSINLLLELLVARLKLVELDESLVELVLLQLDLVSVTLNHDLLNLILLDALSDSILGSRRELESLGVPEGPGAHVEAFKRDTELFTNLRIIDFEDGTSLLINELLLGLLNLTSEDHEAPMNLN